MSQIAELMRMIETAFADTQYPGDENLTHRPDCAYDESEEIRAAFTGRRWQDVSVDQLKFKAFSFLSNAALTYYAPAFMRETISSRSELDVTADGFIRLLDPTPESERMAISWLPRPIDPKNRVMIGDEDASAVMNRASRSHNDWRTLSALDALSLERFSYFVSHLTDVQKSTVKHFLEYVESEQHDEEATTALDKYWRQF